MKLDLNDTETLFDLLVKFNEVNGKVTENEISQGFYKFGAIAFLNFILKEQDNENS